MQHQIDFSPHILVDTTGFVTGGAALELKYHKVESKSPAAFRFSGIPEFGNRNSEGG
jgi:polynucleotide 5'-kinase involved in rRNA processing